MPRPDRRSLLLLLAGLGLPGLAAAQEMPRQKPAPLPPGGRLFADMTGDRCRDSAFSIVNQGEAEIVEIYLRASGQTGNWGEDRLGERTLRRGERLRLDPGAGVHDVLLLTADGRAVAAMRQNACSLSVIRLEADGRLSLT